MTAKEVLDNLVTKVDAEQLDGVETCFHFEFKDEGQHTLEIKEGKMTVSEGLSGEPECVVKSDGEDFVKMMQGDLNPMMAVMMGKIKLSNPGAMIKYAKVLGIM